MAKNASSFRRDGYVTRSRSHSVEAASRSAMEGAAGNNGDGVIENTPPSIEVEAILEEGEVHTKVLKSGNKLGEDSVTGKNGEREGNDVQKSMNIGSAVSVIETAGVKRVRWGDEDVGDMENFLFPSNRFSQGYSSAAAALPGNGWSEKSSCINVSSLHGMGNTAKVVHSMDGRARVVQCIEGTNGINSMHGAENSLHGIKDNHLLLRGTNMDSASSSSNNILLGDGLLDRVRNPVDRAFDSGSFGDHLPDRASPKLGRASPLLDRACNQLDRASVSGSLGEHLLDRASPLLDRAENLLNLQSYGEHGEGHLGRVERPTVEPSNGVGQPNRVEHPAATEDSSKTLGSKDTIVGDNSKELLQVEVSPNTANIAWRDVAKKHVKNRDEAGAWKLNRVELDDADHVVIPLEEISVVVKDWGHTLIGYVAGENPGKGAIISRCKLWKVAHKTFFDESGWIMFRFNRECDRDFVLENGPYLVHGKPLVIKAKPSYFRFGKDEACKVPLWIRLPHLPMELWNDKAISRIASKVGLPMRTDNVTATKEIMSYARVFIEVDLSNELTKEVKVSLPGGKSFVQEIVYEYIPGFCDKCLAIGHTTKGCEARKKQLEANEGHRRTMRAAEVKTPPVVRGQGAGTGNRVKQVYKPKEKVGQPIRDICSIEDAFDIIKKHAKGKGIVGDDLGDKTDDRVPKLDRAAPSSGRAEGSAGTLLDRAYHPLDRAKGSAEGNSAHSEKSEKAIGQAGGPPGVSKGVVGARVNAQTSPNDDCSHGVGQPVRVVRPAVDVSHGVGQFGRVERPAVPSNGVGQLDRVVRPAVVTNGVGQLARGERPAVGKKGSHRSGDELMLKRALDFLGIGLKPGGELIDPCSKIPDDLVAVTSTSGSQEQDGNQKGWTMVERKKKHKKKGGNPRYSR